MSILSDINDIANLAKAEAVMSQMPGRGDGPADAYRHVVLSAELTRVYGETIARLILEEHEIEGRLGSQSPDSESMDRFNNEVGIAIGREATSWNEVVTRARTTIDPNDPTGSAGGARWLSEDRWSANPTDDQNGQRIPTFDANGSFDSRLNWPNPTWPVGPYFHPPMLPAPPGDGNADQDYDDEVGEYDYPRKLGPGDGDPFGMGDPGYATGAESDKAAGGGINSDGTGNGGSMDGAGKDFDKAEDDNQESSMRDPLILDLNGDGIRTISATSGAFFDHDGDGFAEQTGWV